MKYFPRNDFVRCLAVVLMMASLALPVGAIGLKLSWPSKNDLERSIWDRIIVECLVEVHRQETDTKEFSFSIDFRFRENSEYESEDLLATSLASVGLLKINDGQIST